MCTQKLLSPKVTEELAQIGDAARSRISLYRPYRYDSLCKDKKLMSSKSMCTKVIMEDILQP